MIADEHADPGPPPGADTDRPPGDVRSSSKTSYLVQVYFRPLFATAEAMKQLFTSEGFGNVHSIRLRDKFGFVCFQSLVEAQLFIEHFNGFRTGNTTLFVELSNRRLLNHPPCRRLHVTGYDPISVNERGLYWLAAPIGFVRHISFHREFSFIDFDTVDDATRAMEQLNKLSLKGKLLSASFARTAPPTNFTQLTIPLRYILPSDHEFWAELADKLQSK
jgi:hypothetical protein